MRVVSLTPRFRPEAYMGFTWLSCHRYTGLHFRNVSELLVCQTWGLNPGFMSFKFGSYKSTAQCSTHYIKYK